MSSVAPPVIAFELGVGEFRIVTPEAVYQIKVCHDLVEAAPGGADGDSLIRIDENSRFFKEISEELFEQVGRLARQLSVSVEELPGRMQDGDLDLTGEKLENAKGQLQEIVKITEQASMSIMDTADLIQSDMNELTKQLAILNNLDLVSSSAEPAAEGEGAPAAVAVCEQAPLSQDFLNKLGELKALMAKLSGSVEAEQVVLDEAPEPEPAPAPETPPEPAPAPAPEPPPAAGPMIITRFDVDVVFQTLYELCTNESVKDHIKQMREQKAQEFQEDLIADKLSEMAPEVDEEDGFYNFPIIAILKTLYAATANEGFRGTLKKMNQTAGTIFLDTVLPVEGEKVEVEAPALPPPAPEPAPAPAPPPPPPKAPEPAPAPASGGGCSAEDLAAVSALVTDLEALSGAEAAQAIPAGESGLYTSVLTRDRDVVVKTVKTANELIHSTSGHLTNILENLSFQDLSGQRIMKVVALLNDIQKQLLSILISVATKMKVHQDGDATEQTAEKAKQMAQEEVTKALEKLQGGPAAQEETELLGPGAENRLDQGAVNDLLAQLGF